MPHLTIDNKPVEVPEGATILDAARKLGIDIPTMCFLASCKPSASCMVCVVQVRMSNHQEQGRLLPSCATKAVDGMIVLSENNYVHQARRTALELLLSDHVGDCMAPCQLACPAKINIPLFLRHIAAGRIADAQAVLQQSANLREIALLCQSCPAPCKKACRRNQHDSPLAIPELIHIVTDITIVKQKGYRDKQPNNNNNNKHEYSTEKLSSKPFNSHIGKLMRGEINEFLKLAYNGPALNLHQDKNGNEKNDGINTGIKQAENDLAIRNEAARCLHCDCRKPNTCKLRKYARQYQAKPAHYKYSAPNAQPRRRIKIITQHPQIIYEPGKCIKCGLCVQITARHKEELGLTYIGRGFNVQIGVPFNKSLNQALRQTAIECVTACPTAALSLNDT